MLAHLPFDRDSSVFTILSSKGDAFTWEDMIEIVLFLQYSQACASPNRVVWKIEIVLFLQYSQADNRCRMKQNWIEIVLFLQYSQACWLVD